MLRNWLIPFENMMSFENISVTKKVKYLLPKHDLFIQKLTYSNKKKGL